MWIRKLLTRRRSIEDCVDLIGRFEGRNHSIDYLASLLDELNYHLDNQPEDFSLDSSLMRLEVFLHWINVAHYLHLDLALSELRNGRHEAGDRFKAKRVERDILKIKKKIEHIILSF